MIEVLGNPKYKKVYISGPISGITNGNREQFAQYTEKFKNLNFEPVNPHTIHSDEFVNDLNTKLENKEITELEYWVAFMKPDIAKMMDCDIIAVLPKWETSKGANIEVYIAKSLFMPIIDATNLKELF